MKKLLTLGLIILLMSGCLGGMSAEEIGKRMQEKYDGLNDYRGVMVTSFDTGEGTQISEARFAFKKPRKSRYEYLSPDEMKGNVMVSDGETMWIYDAGKNEVQKVAIPSFEMPKMDYGEIIKDMMEKFNVELKGSEKISNRDTYILEMTPKDESGTMKQKLWVDKEHWMPIKIEMEMEIQGKTMKTSLEYRDMEFNVGIPDSEFEFEVPQGAEVEEREMKMPKMFSSVDEAQGEVNFTILQPGYLPEGYALERVTVMDVRDTKSVGISYKKDMEMLTIIETVEEKTTKSREGAETVDINGRTGDFMKLGMNSFLRWSCGDLRFALSSSLEKEEMIQIAESIECGGV